MKKIQKSKNLKEISLDERYVLLYHSIEGNLIKVSRDVLKLIDRASGGYEPSTDKEINLIENMVERGFVEQADKAGEDSIIAKLHGREEDLKKGGFLADIQLSVSNACNMNCQYCFEKKFDNGQRTWDEKMSFDVAKNSIEKVIAKIKETGREYLHVNFFGGEPLTNFAVIKSTLEHFGSGNAYGIKIRYSIDTNGILVTDEVAKTFSEHNVLVNLSIDYVSGGEDYRAGGSSGASFTKFNESIETLSRHGVQMYFLSVLSQDTFEQFGERLIDYAALHNVSGNDVIVSFDMDFSSQYAVNDIVEKLTRYYEYGRGKDIHVGGYWGSIIDQMERKSDRNLEGFKCCPAIGRRLSIEPNGDVFSCKSSSKIHGNMSDLDAVLSSDTYISYGMRAFRNSNACKGCELEGVCSGSCLGMLENKYGTITTMDSHLCTIYRSLVKSVLKVKYA